MLAYMLDPFRGTSIIKSYLSKVYDSDGSDDYIVTWLLDMNNTSFSQNSADCEFTNLVVNTEDLQVGCAYFDSHRRESYRYSFLSTGTLTHLKSLIC